MIFQGDDHPAISCLSPVTFQGLLMAYSHCNSLES